MSVRPQTIVIVGSLAHSLVNFRGPLLRRLKDMGHSVHAWAGEPDPHSLSWLSKNNIPFRPLPVQRGSLRPQQDLSLLATLTRWFRQLKPNSVFLYTIKPVVFGSLAAKAARIPKIYSLITGLGSGLLANQRVQDRIRRKLVHQLYRKSLDYNQCVFFQNPDDRNYFQDNKLLSPAVERRDVAGSGVDIEHFSAVPVPVHPVRFLLLARLLYDKGVAEYVQAARMLKQQYPEAEFVLLGPTDRNPSAVSPETVSRWQAEGVVDCVGLQHDVRPYIKQASVLVLPSYREGTPRSVLEAMAMGRPIITTDAAGCRETVQHGVNGFIVPVRSARLLATAMERFLENPELIESMGQQSLTRAKHIFNVHDVNDDLIDGMGLLRACS